MNRATCAVLAIAGGALLWGCAGGNGPRAERVAEPARMTATRGEVESRLGRPVETLSLGDGARVDVYGAGKGSTLEVLTLGAWASDAGALCELGTGRRIAVAYDRDGRVVAINLGTPSAGGPATAAAPEGLRD
jgi:hypothetical protein